MSAHPSKTSRSGHQSLFYRDLASPISQKGKFSNSGQAAAVTALWRENFGGADPPPPPVFTLEDRIDFSPDIGEFPASPDHKSERKSPSRDSMTPFRGRLSFGGAENTPLPASNVSGTSNWWMSGRSGGGSVEEQRKGSPVDGIVRVESNGGVGLLALPPPREAVRPEVQRSNVPSESMNEEEWVTVYGFSPTDTNLVLREFEKCGVILKHIPGPRDANWMHILYQNHFDAQRALAKNGMQLNGVLIIGVKPLDPMLRQALGEKVGDRAFMILPPQSSAKSPTLSLASKSSEDAMRHTQPRQTPGAIAAPSKSVLSKVMDLMFGV